MHTLSVFITFVAVVIGWVVFRADSLNTAAAMFKGMVGMNGFVLPGKWLRNGVISGIGCPHKGSVLAKLNHL